MSGAGALVGGSTPRASIILDQNARTWELSVQLNKAFAAEANDKKYIYHILVPRKIGCNFVLFRGMTNNRTTNDTYADYNCIAIETTDNMGMSAWDALGSANDVNAHLQLDNGSGAESVVGCFTKYVLTVYVRDGLEMCNLTFCIDGSLYVQCGQMTEGCDKFPVYINYVSESAANGSPTTGSALDAINLAPAP